MRASVIAAALAAVYSLPGTAAAQAGAQPPSFREAFVTTGPAYLTHGDSPLGWGGIVGGGVTLPVFKRLAVRVEGHRSFGPAPEVMSCALYDRPCTGSGRNGASDLTIWNAGAIYYFEGARVRPYLTAGLDVLRFTFTNSITFLGSSPIRIIEVSERHTTMGISVGGGLRVPFGPRLSISPEVMVYDGTILAGANLTQVRTSVVVGYRF